MRTSTLLASIALAVAIAIATVGGTAAATQLRISPGERGLRLTWREFRVFHTFNGTQYSVRCPVTLEGSFHSGTIAKVAGALIGSITRASVNEAECEGIIGTRDEDIYPLNLRFLAETLPWHLRYGSFTGTLPSITHMFLDIVGMSFETEGFVFELICLYRSTTTSPARFIVEREFRSVIVGGRLDSSAEIPRTAAANLLCGRTATTLGMISSVTQLGSTATLSLTLI